MFRILIPMQVLSKLSQYLKFNCTRCFEELHSQSLTSAHRSRKTSQSPCHSRKLYITKKKLKSYFLVNRKRNIYFLVVIFFPLTNLVDVDVLLTLALVGVPFVKVLLNVLKDVKPPPAPLENKSSIRLPPKAKPNGFISCVCKALWGWEWRLLLERSLCEEWSCKSLKKHIDNLWKIICSCFSSTSEEILKNWSTKKFPKHIFRVSERKETKAHIIIIIVSSTATRSTINEAFFAIVIVSSSLFVWKKTTIKSYTKSIVD